VEQNKRRIQVGQEWVEAMPVTFRPSGENWNEYLLSDGTVIKVKLVATEVFRVDGRYDREGNPLYVVKSANVMVANAPESLRKKG
jgi:hypothetical protein